MERSELASQEEGSHQNLTVSFDLRFPASKTVKNISLSHLIYGVLLWQLEVRHSHGHFTAKMFAFFPWTAKEHL